MIDEFDAARRSVVGGLVGASALSALWPRRGFAEQSCRPVAGGQACTAQVEISEVVARYDTQHQSEWCWAACIEMLFSFYGHHVPQEQVVTDVYGGLVNMPSGSGYAISRQLNRQWTDTDGNAFTSRVTKVFDLMAGYGNGLDNQFIADHLADDKPLIMGARSHAMLVTRFDYMTNGYAIQPVAVGVLDPWPGKGARALEPDEMKPAFLPGGSLWYVVAIDVEDAD